MSKVVIVTRTVREEDVLPTDEVIQRDVAPPTPPFLGYRYVVVKRAEERPDPCGFEWADGWSSEHLCYRAEGHDMPHRCTCGFASSKC